MTAPETQEPAALANPKILQPPKVERDRPFPAPGRLAFSLALVAALGPAMVAAAFAFGASASTLACVAVGGFGLCALAPMALIDVFVERPLRAALAALRAARDGRTPERAVFASGLLADLVHIARDIHAAQTSLDQQDDLFTRREPQVGASDEALHALRLQVRELAEVALQSQPRLAAPARGGDAATVGASFEPALERLEAMLVYIAETLDRTESEERRFDGAFGRIEQGIGDLARALASQSAAARGGGDLAAFAAEEKTARTRLFERLDRLEARLAAPVASPDAQALVETVRAEAEATRRALSEPAGAARLDALAEALSRVADQVGQALAKLERPQEDAALRADLAGFAADLSHRMAELGVQMNEAARAPASLDEPMARRLAEIEQNVADKVVAVGRDNEATTLMALLHATKQIGESAARLDGVALRPTPEAEALAALDARLGAFAARVEANIAPLAVALDVEGLRGAFAAVEARVGEVAGRVEASLAGAPEAGEVQAAFALIATRIGEVAAKLAEPAGSADFEDLRAALAAHEARFGDLAARVEATLAPLASAPDGQELRSAFSALDARLGEVAARVETNLAPLAGAPDAQELRAAFSALDARLGEVGARVEATLAGAADAEDLRAAFAALDARLGDVAARVETSLAPLAGTPDADTLRATFAALEARLADVAAHVAATLAPLAAAPDARALFSALDARLADIAARVEAAASLQDGRLDAFETHALAPACDALCEAQEAFAAAQAQLAAHDPALAQVVASAGALEEKFEALTARLPAAIVKVAEAQGAALSARIEAAAREPVEAALAGVAEGFVAAQTRLGAAAARVEAEGVAALAAMRAEFEAVARAAPGWLQPSREALVEAQQGLEAAQAAFDTAAREAAATRSEIAALGLDRLPEVASDLAKTQAEERERASDLDRHIRTLAGLVDADAGRIEALRAALAARFDAAADAQVERVARPLAALSQTLNGLVAAQAQLQAALDSPYVDANAEAAIERLRADFAAAGAATRAQLDATSQALTRTLEDGVESLRRGAFAPAVAALQATTQDINKANAEVFAVVESLRSDAKAGRVEVTPLRRQVA